MAQPRSKARSTRNGKDSLKQREYRDEQGRVHHHTKKYMEGGKASQSGPQKRDRSSSASMKRRSDQSDQGSSLHADRLNGPKSSMAQPRSKGRSTQSGKNGLKQREYLQEQSNASRRRRSEQSEEGSSVGNLAQSIADRPGLLLAAVSAAAAATGTLLMSRWLGKDGWLRRRFGHRSDDESFTPGTSWAEDRNEARASGPAQHTRLEHPSLGGVNEPGFEGAKASERQEAAQARRQNQGSSSLSQEDRQPCNQEEAAGH